MLLSDITYLSLQDKMGVQQYIFLDLCKDTSIDNSSKITEDPIDAVMGTSLQERAIREATTLGVSGSFSNRNSGRIIKLPSNSKILFLNEDRRLENIINWFDNAIENSTIFTVCKKGVIYHNQLLNSIKWTFDDSASKIDVSLSFIEVINVERAESKGSCEIIISTSKKVSGVRENALNNQNNLKFQAQDIYEIN